MPLFLRCIGVFITFLMLLYINQFNTPGNKVKEQFNSYTKWITYSQTLNYSRNGVVSGILYNLKAPIIDELENYSKDRIQEIYDKYSKEAKSINSDRDNTGLDDVNIIYIMNETFSDAHRIDGIEIEGQDTLTNYREFLPNYKHGYSLSQAIGGGTANIEFEALTGISIEPLNGNTSIPYIHMSDYIPSLPSILKYDSIQNNHKLTSIHPFNHLCIKEEITINHLSLIRLFFKMI